MRIEYDEWGDTLCIVIRDGRIVRDVSHGWTLTVGYAEGWPAQVTILDAAASGGWPTPMEALIARLSRDLPGVFTVGD